MYSLSLSLIAFCLCSISRVCALAIHIAFSSTSFTFLLHYHHRHLVINHLKLSLSLMWRASLLSPLLHKLTYINKFHFALFHSISLCTALVFSPRFWCLCVVKPKFWRFQLQKAKWKSCRLCCCCCCWCRTFQSQVHDKGRHFIIFVLWMQNHSKQTWNQIWMHIRNGLFSNFAMEIFCGDFYECSRDDTNTHTHTKDRTDCLLHAESLAMKQFSTSLRFLSALKVYYCWPIDVRHFWGGNVKVIK